MGSGNGRSKLHLHRTEGGQGGKRGHSGMDHWEYTNVIKAESDRRRRREDKKAVEEQFGSDASDCRER